VTASAVALEAESEGDNWDAETKTQQALRRWKRHLSLQAGAEAAAKAAVEVARAAHHHNGCWFLPADLVLRGLTRNRQVGLVVFSVEGDDVAIGRHLLMQFSKVARRLPGLTCFVDNKALYFRWRDGRGGLNLTASTPSRWDEYVHVVLARVRQEASASAPILPPQQLPVRQPRHWLRDVLEHLAP